ncbi:MAG TPA: protein kinase [Pyrinomonadaceae bacterium]|nr:protein kinase [Pyrinomonadaceae bacterium]
MNQLEDIPANSMIGRRIGAYRLDEEVGRGGMGVVYRATRVDGEFDQTVAVKLIKRGMDTDLVLKRFRRERQITAALNHPNIAYFFGGGSTDDGLPYFVMEFIVGSPLYKYCDENRLSLRERLAVFRQICWAVQAAHDIQVIHRDLKPSNIMVTANGKPKLLDFGIAKALDPELMSTEDVPTATQLRAMTPEYASPEQISGDTVGPTSDIYSLGVILYELLTGHRPYRLRRKIADEVARVIREEEPTSPSGSLTQDEILLPQNGNEPSLDRVLAARNSSLEALKRELSGDLDRIVLKALRKRPTDRYQSASELADDITNFVEGRPVNAEFFVSMANIPKPKVSDKLSVAILPFKTFGQAPGDTGEEFMGIGLTDALITRLSGVQRLVVRPTSSILQFVNADPFEAGRRLGVDYVLDGNVRMAGSRIRVSVQLLNVSTTSTRWAKAFDSEMTDVLELEDTLSEHVTGSLLPQLTTEEQARVEKRGTNKPAAFEAYLRGRYFWSKFTDSDLLKAVEAFKQAIEIDPNYAWPYIGLADFYTWSAIFGEMSSLEAFPKAIAAAQRALEIDDTLGEAYAALAFGVFLSDWNWSDAESLAKRAIELSPNYPFAHECYSNYLVAQGRYDEGILEIKLAEELDPGSPRALVMTSWVLYQCRQFEGAVAKATQATEMQNDFPQGLLHLGNSLTGLGRYEEAVAVLRNSSELWGDSGMPRYMLAHARAASGDMVSAQKILDKMLETAERKHVKPYFIGMCYVAVGDYDSAFQWFERAVAEGNEWMIWFGCEPKLDPLRSDPRYLKILQATNNPMADEQRARAITSPPTGERERSIAVLPFKLVSAHDTGSSDDEYLSLGIADAVTMRLSNVRRFLVRPTSSVLPFSGSDTDAFAAGRELGVEYVVDGIIRHIGGRIRVTAQLLDVSENSTRWSASFAEEMKDVLELEDSISEQVTRQLLPHLTGEEKLKLAKRGTDSAEAHDAYLKGRFFWNQFVPDSFPKAITAFRQAIEFDPNYALAHVGVADYFTWACIYGIEQPDLGFPQVYESAMRALEIDPTLAEAYAALGLYYSNIQEWAKAEEFYRKCLELNPNYPLGHEWLSAVLVGTGRYDEGTTEILTAEALDPLSLRPKTLSAWTLYQARNYGMALEKARMLERLDPNYVQSHIQLTNILSVFGDPEEALLHARKATEMEPDSPLIAYPLCYALVNAGLREEAEGVVARWMKIADESYVPPYFLGLCCAALGHKEQAVEYLEAARVERSAWILWMATEPKLDFMRDFEPFKEVLKKTGLPIVEIPK